MLIRGESDAARLSCLIAHMFADLEPPCGRCRGGGLAIKGITVTGQAALLVAREDGYTFSGSPEDCATAKRLMEETCKHER